MKCQGFGYSVIGGRDSNQDAYLIDDNKGLYAVADGVGGGFQGDVASAMAVEGVRAKVQGQKDLRPTFEGLQQQILGEAEKRFGEALMGTTLTAILFDDKEFQLCHVGDSRCYLFREASLFLLSHDQEFYDSTVGGTVLAGYLGMPLDEKSLPVEEEVFPVFPGDQILLCTDGLYRQLPEDEILKKLTAPSQSPQELVISLCEEVGQDEYSDNVTVILVSVS